MDKTKMLIDASHPEETRVVVVRNGRVEEFDYESVSRKLLKGNIYLAKVTRVEPSLQAAFVEYGGNRHGFLAFSEIHPDYYQIPVADRELLKQQEAEADADGDDDEPRPERSERRRPRRSRWRRGEKGDRRSSQNAARDSDATDAEATSVAVDQEPAQSVALDARELSDVLVSEALPPPSAEAAEEPAVGPAGEAVALTEGKPQDAQPEISAVSEMQPEAPVAAAEAAADAVTDVAPPAPSHEASEQDGAHAVAPEHPAAQNDNETDGEPAARDTDDAYDDSDDDGDELSVRDSGNGDADGVEQVASEEDAMEELPERPRRRARQYKIQEVIKRRQVMLVQVVKEERGSKGAALTTYISLAGRYTVLMPNSGRGGGISRKITQPQDRKRLKAIAQDLDVSEGMGLIIRTAGASRSMQEIKRDYEYLLRLWESVRELTLASTAPSLVYEEGNLIKRSIRDLYSKDIDEILVAGEPAHVEARDFMSMLMPGHADYVVRYDGHEPLFPRFGVERQLNQLYNPRVTLRSGGYIIINQTEALVAVDVNSGKSTREFSIEETALNTNIEAAEEIARQIRLRDLAGLIVIDFIDMEEKRNNRTVERRLKDALRHDRARIQVGRISHFGLLEMSRQRLRTGMVEGSTSQCPHCEGTGIIRSTESVALAVLRGLEDHLMKQPSSLCATAATGVAIYLLNQKRGFIGELERRHGVTIAIEANDRMQGVNFSIERSSPVTLEHVRPTARGAVNMEWGFGGSDDIDDIEPGVEEIDTDEPMESHRGERAERAERGGDRSERGGDREGAEDGQRSRRRRRRRGRRDREGGSERASEPMSAGEGEFAGESDRDHDHDHDRGHAHEHRHERHVHAHDDGDEVETINRDAESAADDESSAQAPRPSAEREEDGERPRRGRRRGRRGGRSRMREGGSEGREDGGTSEGRGEGWGLSDVAMPGAEQPSLIDERDLPVHRSRAEQEEAAPEGDAGRDQTSQQAAPAEPELPFEASQPAPVASQTSETAAPVAAPADAAAQEEPAVAASDAAVPQEPAPAAPTAAAPTVESPAAPEVKAEEPVAPPVAATPPAPAAENEPKAEAEVPREPAQAEEPKADVPGQPARRGWWQRKFGSGS
ncbi:MAG: Rne/Rng family ribonuclease [Hyphomicrobiaceae bacterium]